MKPFAQLLSVEDALQQVLGLAFSLPTEEAEISDAVGRATVADIAAERTLPPWDNSAMDGYAIRSTDLAKVPWALRVADRIMAGQRSSRELQPGECARIMTGAPLPPGADAVVMQERTQSPPDAPDQVTVLQSVPPRANVRQRGEESSQGQLLLPAGTSLGVPEAALLWAQGLTRVTVPRRPSVAIASTGNELIPVGHAASLEDQIVDTNSPSLALAVRRTGGTPTLLGLAPDQPEALEALLQNGVDFDVLLTSAGVSVGERDFTREVLTRLGVELKFWGVAMKPGKPLVVGRWGRTVVFGLPGNPVSSLVCFELFVRPLLRRLLGHREVAPPMVQASSAVTIRKASGLTHFIRVRAAYENGTLTAYPLASQSSGALRSAAQATHLMRIPSEVTEVVPGDPVALLPVNWLG